MTLTYFRSSPMLDKVGLELPHPSLGNGRMDPMTLGGSASRVDTGREGTPSKRRLFDYEEEEIGFTALTSTPNRGDRYLLTVQL